MRVLLVTDWMADRGGAEEYARALRTAMAAAGDEVRLMTSSAGSAAEGTADFVAWGTRRAALQSVVQIVNPSAVATARAAVRGFRPDVALVLLFAYHLSPAVVFALRGVPTVLSMLDYKAICPLGTRLLPNGQICRERAGLCCWQHGCLSAPHWLRDQARYALIRAASRGATHVLASSRHMQGQLSEAGIASTHLTLPRLRAEQPSLSRAPAPNPLFVYCGRLSAEKGVNLLLAAFRRLVSDIPRARLRIVGDGPARRDVEGQIAALDLGGAVSLTGLLPRADVDRQLVDAWALVAPSIWAEPFGMVAIDAIAQGVPVIASRVGGFGETVEHGVSGLLFPNGDEDALLGCLQRVARGEAFPGGVVADEAIRWIRERHALSRHVEALRAVLLEPAASSNLNGTA